MTAQPEDTPGPLGSRTLFLRLNPTVLRRLNPPPQAFALQSVQPAQGTPSAPPYA